MQKSSLLHDAASDTLGGAGIHVPKSVHIPTAPVVKRQLSPSLQTAVALHVDATVPDPFLQNKPVDVVHVVVSPHLQEA